MHFLTPFKTRIRAVLSNKKAPQAHASPEPPKLENLEFLPHNMSLDGVPGVVSEESSPTVVTSASPATRTSKSSDTPTRISLANVARFSSPPPPDNEGMRSPSAVSSQPGTPTNETVPGWCVLSWRHDSSLALDKYILTACYSGQLLWGEPRLESQGELSRS